MSLIRKNKEGFTLIELVIVLAIAALILAAIFLAISGAQRTRRDSQRTGDLGKIVSQLENYASNNQGCYPGVTTGGCNTPAFSGGATTFWTQYELDASGNPVLRDPASGNGYGPQNGGALPTVDLAGGTAANVYYFPSSVCSGNAAVAAGTTRQFAVLIQLENGVLACRDNH